jgi:hypothetical protein
MEELWRGVHRRQKGREGKELGRNIRNDGELISEEFYI